MRKPALILDGLFSCNLFCEILVHDKNIFIVYFRKIGFTPNPYREPNFPQFLPLGVR